MDSRDYIFSFGLESLSEVPPDFDLPPDLDALEAGVFLPQSEKDWLGRRKYPARILLLTGREVVLAAHPASGEPLTRVPLGCLESAECGRILLMGWITLFWAGGNRNLQYNTGTAGPVEAFIKKFMDRWLPQAPERAAGDCLTFGKSLDLKFGYARSAELLPGESLLLQFFQPASFGGRRAGIFRKRVWQAGDLLAATSRRLLWITERHRAQYEPYGTVSRSAPLAFVSGLRSRWVSGVGDMEVIVGTGLSWRLPLRDSEEGDARKFEAALGGLI
ncbi:MAG: hypothetical protein ACE141_12200 [Bryobacteraceae bacterium]